MTKRVNFTKPQPWKVLFPHIHTEIEKGIHLLFTPMGVTEEAEIFEFAANVLPMFIPGKSNRHLEQAQQEKREQVISL